MIWNRKQKRLYLIIAITSIVMIGVCLFYPKHTGLAYAVVEMEVGLLIYGLTRHFIYRRYYRLLSGAIGLCGVIDLVEYITRQLGLSDSLRLMLSVMFLLPGVMILISIGYRLIIKIPYMSLSKLLIDSYKVVVVVIVFTYLLFLDMHLGEWLVFENSAYMVIAIIYGVAFILTLSILFVLIYSKQTIKNISMYLPYWLFYVLYIFRFTTFSYTLNLFNLQFYQLAHIAAVFGMNYLLWAIIKYRDIIEIDLVMDQEENGKALKMNFISWFVLLLVIGLYLGRIISLRSSLELLTIIILLKALDWFAERSFAVNKRLNRLVSIDSLTGLYNRKYFLDKIQALIYEGNHEFTLLYMDLNRFKTINDVNGHNVGDEVLKVVGHRMNEFQSEHRMFARLGGDEFGAIILNAEENYIRELAEKIELSIGNKIDVNHVVFSVGTSIGAVRYPKDGADLYSLYKYADIAMYTAKKSSKTNFVIHSGDLSEALGHRNEIELALKNMDIEKDFELFYQPQIDCLTGQMTGIEALLRWNCEGKGYISPAEFIPLAEEIGIINSITKWVFDEGIQQINKWNNRYDRNLILSLNVSPINIHNAAFISDLKMAIKKYGCDPTWIGVEITEMTAMTSPIYMKNLLNRLSAIGLKIAIDDFGTGYSSLSYIKKFDIDELKIAKELIDNIEMEHDDLIIVNSIIMMAKALGVKTVAEGVETNGQLKLLRNAGCTSIQGYIYGKPMNNIEFEKRYLKGER